MGKREDRIYSADISAEKETTCDPWVMICREKWRKGSKRMTGNMSSRVSFRKSGAIDKAAILT